MAGAGAAAPLGRGTGLAGKVWPWGWGRAPSWLCQGLPPAGHGSAACFSSLGGSDTAAGVPGPCPWHKRMLERKVL